MFCLDVYEQLKTQLWEDDAVTGLFVIKTRKSLHFAYIVFRFMECFILMMFVVTGEACGLAMGLVMLGSKSATAIEEMVGVS